MGHISLRSVEMRSFHSLCLLTAAYYSLTFNGTVRSPDAMSLSSWCRSPLRNSTNQPSQRSTTFFSLVQTCRDDENEKFYVRNCRDWVCFLYISFLFFWERQLLHSLWATWVIVLMWFRKKCYWVCPMRMTLEWHAQWMDFWCCFVQIVFRNLRMNVTSLVFEEITHQYPFEGNVFNSPAFCFSSYAIIQ